jgi:hypothetical protein
LSRSRLTSTVDAPKARPGQAPALLGFLFGACRGSPCPNTATSPALSNAEPTVGRGRWASQRNGCWRWSERSSKNGRAPRQSVGQLTSCETPRVNEHRRWCPDSEVRKHSPRALSELLGRIAGRRLSRRADLRATLACGGRT